MPVAVKLSKFLRKNEIKLGDQITNGKFIWTATEDASNDNPYYLKCNENYGHINPHLFRFYWIKNLTVHSVK